MNEAQLELDIEKAIKLLAEVHGARLSEPRKNRYVRKLSRLGQSTALFRVLDKACDDDRMPTPSMLCEQVNAEIARAKPVTAQRALSADEKRSADKALLRSIVWLHLVKGWQPHDFANTMFARRMGRDENDYGEFLRAAVLHENWTRESIDEWMQLALSKADAAEARATPRTP